MFVSISVQRPFLEVGNSFHAAIRYVIVLFLISNEIRMTLLLFYTDTGVVLTSTLRATSLIFQLLQLRATTFLCSDCDPW